MTKNTEKYKTEPTNELFGTLGFFYQLNLQKQLDHQIIF